MTPAPPARASARTRLPPEQRRRQLLEVAAGLLGRHGVAGLEFKELAALARVTRPVVYRFFPDRLALVEAVLIDFVDRLQQRFHAALARNLGAAVDDHTHAFIAACCDAIEDGGKGAWQLMYARGPDVEAARLGRAALDRLMRPWLPRVAELTGLSAARVGLLAGVFVAAGGAALDGWLAGELARDEAVDLAARSVSALLREFS